MDVSNLAQTETRRCTKCGDVKPLTEFPKPKGTPPREGRTYSWCKTCYLKRKREDYKNPAVSARVNATQRALRRANPERAVVGHRQYNLRFRFGMELEDYARLLEKQHGLCAICGQPETRIVNGSLAYLAVDHDHTTGIVRGLLCSACNVKLGGCEDDMDWLSNAILYLANPPALTPSEGFLDVTIFKASTKPSQVKERENGWSRQRKRRDSTPTLLN